MRDITLPVPVSQIWDALSDFPYGMTFPSTWAECLRMAGLLTRGDVIGEVLLKGDAQPDDFKSVPIGPLLRVVMIQMPQEEGFILRWGDHNQKMMEQLLSGYFHEHLLHAPPSQFEAVRSGYIIVEGYGGLRVG